MSDAAKALAVMALVLLLAAACVANAREDSAMRGFSHQCVRDGLRVEWIEGPHGSAEEVHCFDGTTPVRRFPR